MFWKKIVYTFFSSMMLIQCTVESEFSVSVPDADSVTSLPFYHTPDFDPIWNPGNKDTLHTINPFSFTDHNGQPFSDQTVSGKIYLVNFFFTHCGSICPKMMRNMEKLEKDLLGYPDVLFVSHTVTPWIDTAEVLKKYSENYEVIDSRWFLVTGPKAEVYDLARRSYFVEEEPGFVKDSSEFLHTEHVVLIDRNRHIRGIYNGTLELEMERAKEDVLLLLNEPH